jgi:predicted ArsR family transcriptional regulator
MRLRQTTKRHLRPLVRLQKNLEPRPVAGRPSKKFEASSGGGKTFQKNLEPRPVAEKRFKKIWSLVP